MPGSSRSLASACRATMRIAQGQQPFPGVASRETYVRERVRDEGNQPGYEKVLRENWGRITHAL
eukprot:14598736-Alexandrium_andersonii.AAC.1